MAWGEHVCLWLLVPSQCHFFKDRQAIADRDCGRQQLLRVCCKSCVRKLRWKGTQGARNLAQFVFDWNYRVWFYHRLTKASLEVVFQRLGVMWSMSTTLQHKSDYCISAVYSLTKLLMHLSMFLFCCLELLWVMFVIPWWCVQACVGVLCVCVCVCVCVCACVRVHARARACKLIIGRYEGWLFFPPEFWT